MKDEKQDAGNSAFKSPPEPWPAAPGATALASACVPETIVRRVMAHRFSLWWSASEWHSQYTVREMALAQDAFASGMLQNPAPQECALYVPVDPLSPAVGVCQVCSLPWHLHSQPALNAFGRKVAAAAYKTPVITELPREEGARKFQEAERDTHAEVVIETANKAQATMLEMIMFASTGRCMACGWQLKTSADEGCVQGNCSFRPGEHTFDYQRWWQRTQILSLAMKYFHGAIDKASTHDAVADAAAGER